MTDSMVKKRVLLAEDAAATQDIVKLVLNQRGHEVSIANDGKETLELLTERDFDIAIVDFHLPVMTGLEATVKYLSKRQGALIPRLIAFTGDLEGLREAEGDVTHFDYVLSKPFKIDEIIPIIENEDSVQRIYLSDDREVVDKAKVPETTELPLEDTDYYLIHYPRDFYGSFRNAVSMRITSEGIPDALIIHEPLREQDIDLVAKVKGLHLTPIVDLTQTLGHRADCTITSIEDSKEKLAEIINDFADRRSTIHTDFDLPENDEELLISRMYMSGQKLMPELTWENPECAHFNTLISAQRVIEAAESLVKRGLMESQFFERINRDPESNSGRIIAREICPTSGSANLREEYYLHHYRCGWQAPMSEFKQGYDLICPRCNVELTHFGKDYDKPGTMLICEESGEKFDEPDIEYICIDTGRKFKGEQAKSTDLNSYQLSTSGQEFIEAGRIALGDVRRTFKFSDIPIDMVVELNSMAKEFNENGKEFFLISIGFKNLRALEREYGVRDCNQAREMLTQMLSETLSDRQIVGSGTTHNYLLTQSGNKESLLTDVENSLKRIRNEIRLPLEAVSRVFDPHDLGT